MSILSHILTLLFSKVMFQIQILLERAADFSKFAIPERLNRKGGKEVILSYTKEAQDKYKPINLGTGFPDFGPPDSLKTTLVESSNSADYTVYQYARLSGHLRLVNALANFYSKRFDKKIDAEKEIIVTTGAIQALFSAIQTHTNTGDEWIVFEPFYDNYDPIIKSAFGVVRFVTLKPKISGDTCSANDYEFEIKELERLFNKRTKGIILNTPMNPIGKVFKRDELEIIANLAKKWDTLVIADEVYEFLIFDDNEHISIATLPGMFERTITIGSGGKSFSATGLRVGWAYGGAKIIKNLMDIQEFVSTCVPIIIQEAFAAVIENEIAHFGTEKSYLSNFNTLVQQKRNNLIKAFKDIGMEPIVPQGGYFLVVNWTEFGDKINFEDLDVPRGIEFLNWQIKNLGIQGVPLSAYYSENSQEMGEEYIRYNMVKKTETINIIVSNMNNWVSSQNC